MIDGVKWPGGGGRGRRVSGRWVATGDGRWWWALVAYSGRQPA